MVIEDHFLAQKIALSILHDLYCDVDIAENGTRALGLLHENQYDLVFVDLGLPDYDGFTITQQIRSKSSISSIPIIGLSVHATQQSKVQALNSGMNAYITKPLTIENCTATLKEFLPRSRESIS